MWCIFSFSPSARLLWLQKHNPVIDWVLGRVIRWSSFCHSTCLKSPQPPCALKNWVTLPEPPDVSSVLLTMTLLRCSASTGPCLFLPTGLMTAPLTCYWELPFPPADSTVSLPQIGRPWGGTSQSLWIEVSSDPLPLGAVFFYSWRWIRL